MNMPNRHSPLVLGGHSFIPELGNDSPIDRDTQLVIVNACLDAGIRCFDTTYEPERVALGRILEELGRRDEAQIIAWNFFVDEVTGKYRVPSSPYEAHHIDKLLEQLRTDHIDLLVVHPGKAEDANATGADVALSWLKSGYVGALGTWSKGRNPTGRFGADNPYSFMAAPRNVANPNLDIFRAGKEMGWRTFATSPFGRGWLLDRLVAVAAEQSGESPESSRARLADTLLRFSIHCPDVDYLIVGIRKQEWICQNIDSVRKGPLSEEETAWLVDLQDQAEATRKQE